MSAADDPTLGRSASVERRVVCVLFADLVGFTPLSERLDAEDVAAVQDAYFAAVRETIARHGGILEKFIGDAAMAVFGLDRARDDDAERAVRAGLSLIGAVERLGGQLGLGAADLQLRVGIENGEVVSAEGGPDQGRVTGDVVNTAARLQAAAPPGGVLLGEGAILAAAAAVELGPTQPLELKGKAGPVRAALAIGLRPEPRRDAAMGALRAPMVGRERELERIQSAGREAAAGRAVAVVLIAPPGTGKSRLLAEFLAGARGALWRTRARSDSGASIEPIVELARAATVDLTPEALLARLADGQAEGRAQVLAETLAELTGSSTEGRDTTDRDVRFAAWIEALDALAVPGPAVWAVEDIHWASGDVLAFLAAAVRAPSRHGRLILATARPSVAERLDERLEHIELGPLPPADAGRLITALVGDALPPDLVASIEERSDGNPLFIEELLRSWVATGTLEPSDGRWRLTRAPATIALPTTVQAIYAGQLDDLPPPAREVARRASVAGRRFPEEALAALGVGSPAVGMDELLARSLVSGPIADHLTGPGYAYRHALLRDAGYSSLGRADRARLHVRLARWLESVAGDGRDTIADRIGGHYEAAVAAAPALATEVAEGLSRSAVAETAAGWLERAAEHALSLGARDAAVELLRRSLAQTSPPDGDAAGRRMVRLARTLAESGDLSAARDLAERAEAIQRSAFLAAASDPASQAAARSAYAGATDVRADIEAEQLHFLEARALAETTLAELGDPRDLPWARLRLRVARAMALWDDTYDVPAVEEVLAIATREGDKRLIVDALASLASFSADEPQVAIGRLEELANLAATEGEWRQVSWARRIQAVWLDMDGGDPWPLLAEAAEVAEAHGLREQLGWAEYTRAEIGLRLGEWDLADTAARRAIGLAETYAYTRVAVRTWFALAPIAAARADRPTLERGARYFSEHDADFPDSPYGRLMHSGLDVILQRAGLTPTATIPFEHLRTSFEQDVDGATATEAVWRILATWIDEERWSDVEAALQRIRDGFPGFPTTDLVRGAIDVVEGYLRLRRSDGEAVDALRSGLGRLRAMRATWWIRRALRLLETAGAATGSELAEAAAIDARLGVVNEEI